MWTDQGSLVYCVVWALLSLCFPSPGHWAATGQSSSKSQSLLPAAIKGVFAAVMQEMAVPLFLVLLGVRRSSGQACSESGGSSGERAPGFGFGFAQVWSCTLLSIEQPSSFWMNRAWTFCPGASPVLGCPGLCRAKQLRGVRGAPHQPHSAVGWEQPL